MDALTWAALAARDGDRDALARFVREGQSDVWRLAAHLVDRQAADDLTQETFERALRALSAFRGDASARTWLLSIARRTCADAIRRRERERKRANRLEALATESMETSPEVSSTAELERLLGVLDPDRRTAFVLTQLLGYPYAEAAVVVGCPVGTIRSRVARAREDLIEHLGEVIGDGHGDEDPDATRSAN